MNTNQQLSDFLSHVGKNLYRARNTRNEKLTSVAKEMGVSHSVISQIENGRYNSLSMALLIRLISYYNLTFDQLVQAGN